MLAENLDELKSRGVVDDDFDLDDYVDVDFDVSTNETLTDKEILSAVSNIEDDGAAEEELIVDGDESPKKPSLSDAGEALEFIELFDDDGDEWNPYTICPRSYNPGNKLMAKRQTLRESSIS